MRVQAGLPPLNWLRAFEASARHLSFTGAAGELNMTQSAVSQQIKSLEARLGRRLFHRRPRRLELTETGTSYLPIVRDAFRTLARGTRAVTGAGAGHVQVHSNMSFASIWLAPRLPDFYAQHPDVRLDIMAEVWEPQGLVTGADVEIRYSVDPGPDVPAERLVDEHCYPVAAPGWQGGPEDILEARLFGVSNLLSDWASWAEEQGLDTTGLRVERATTYAVTLHAAMAGAGLAMAHDTIAARLIAEGRLQDVGGYRARMAEAYHLILAPHAIDIPGAVAFANWVRNTRRAETGARAV